MVKAIFATVVIGSLSLPVFAGPPVVRTLQKSLSQEYLGLMNRAYEREMSEQAFREELKKLSKSEDAQIQVMAMDAPPPGGPGAPGGGSGKGPGKSGDGNNWDQNKWWRKDDLKIDLSKLNKDGSKIEFRSLEKGHDVDIKKFEFIVTSRSVPGVVAQERFHDKSIGTQIFRVQDSVVIQNDLKKTKTSLELTGKDLKYWKLETESSSPSKQQKLFIEKTAFDGSTHVHRDVLKFELKGGRISMIYKEDGKFGKVIYALPTKEEGTVSKLDVVGRQSLTLADIKDLGLFAGTDLKKLREEKGQLFRTAKTSSPSVEIETKGNGGVK